MKSPRARSVAGLLASVLWLAFISSVPTEGAGGQAPSRSPGSSKAPSRERTLRVAREIMTAARYATMVTTKAGEAQARIVDPLTPDASLVVYVATNPKSRKVAEIRADPRVTLLYFDTNRLAYVTLVGRATAVAGEEKATRHKNEWKPFFNHEQPETYTLYRILPSRLEVVSAKDGLSGDPLTWRPKIVDIR